MNAKTKSVNIRICHLHCRAARRIRIDAVLSPTSEAAGDFDAAGGCGRHFRSTAPFRILQSRDIWMVFLEALKCVFWDWYPSTELV